MDDAHEMLELKENVLEKLREKRGNKKVVMEEKKEGLRWRLSIEKTHVQLFNRLKTD